MNELNIDVVISAPQKGWTSQACCGMVLLSKLATNILLSTNSNSFCVNLKQWYNVMQAYINGGAKYYATMPTDALKKLNDVINEANLYSFNLLKEKQWELGNKIRDICKNKYNLISVASKNYQSPGVIVLYDPIGKIVQKFIKYGIQIVGGVPLMIDYNTNSINEHFNTFRIGLFGLDKLYNIEKTIEIFDNVLSQIFQN